MSADDRNIAYLSVKEVPGTVSYKYSHDIYVSNIDGTNLRKIYSFESVEPLGYEKSLSWIASDKVVVQILDSMCVVNLSGTKESCTELNPLVHDANASVWSLYKKLKVSSDGKQYTGVKTTLTKVDNSAMLLRQDEIVTGSMSVNGSTRVAVTFPATMTQSDSYQIRDVVWSPDSAKLAYTVAGGYGRGDMAQNTGLFIVKSDGTSKVQFESDVNIVGNGNLVWQKRQRYYYNAITPTRIADTRPNSGTPYASKTLQPNTSIDIGVVGAAGVPAGATAAVINVTSVNSTKGGYLTVYPSGTARPTTSFLNFQEGQVVAKETIAKLASNGKITIYNGSAASVNVIVDVVGYYVPVKTGLSFVTSPAVAYAKVPTTSDSTSIKKLVNGGIIGPNKSVNITDLATNNAVPAEAQALVLSVCVAGEGKGGGFLKVYPTGASIPSTSSINFTAENAPDSANLIGFVVRNMNGVCNEVTTKVGSNGSVTILNGSTTDRAFVEVFVHGYYY